VSLRSRAFLSAVLVLVLGGCSQLPPLAGRNESVAAQDTEGTALGVALRPLLQAHPGRSGIVPLADGHDAFAARVTLAGAAQRTLDVQYYIWRNDTTGAMLFQALRDAADRGVRVRLLLDDNNTKGLDAVLAALDAHANIEVRLFNPFAHRSVRAIDFLTDFRRVNRRMHNKSFTADNQVTIVGGRNIGDEYFDAGAGLLFVDLDVLAAGPVVPQVSRDFDRYWASLSAYPLAGLVPATTLADGWREEVAVPEPADARAYRDAVARSRFVRDLAARQLAFEWAPVHMVSDDPAKVLGGAATEDLLWSQLQRAMPPTAREVQLVSPYFVPTERGTAYFIDLARRGVQVSVLTNALEATDVPAVHSGYARWRTPLLEGGVKLYEMQRSAAPPPSQGPRLGGSSTASLHAKTFAVDRQRVFVGSFNFDPRSARLNTELGFLIESPVLAAAMADAFEASVPQRAYTLRLHEGRLQWLEQQGAGVVVHDQEPNASAWTRLAVWFLSLLPIESLL
jgi:putative cardiolipin synthase